VTFGNRGPAGKGGAGYGFAVTHNTIVPFCETSIESDPIVNFSELTDYRSLFGRALRLPLCLLPKSARMPILQGPLRGKRWIVGSSNHGCWLGSYEYGKQAAFAASIRPGDVVYDIGAHVGFYSLLASVIVGPEGRVFSFEPFPENLAFLRKHLEMNLVMNCVVCDVAIGRSEGVAAFSPGPASTMGRLSQDANAPLSVRTVSLDAFVFSSAMPPPNVIKCDIEGGEYDALLGASTLLAKYHPTIFLATHGSAVHSRCCELLQQFGYQLKSLDGRPLDESSEILAVRGEPFSK
jgi:FkbM family methyltransferase